MLSVVKFQECQHAQIYVVRLLDFDVDFDSL